MYATVKYVNFDRFARIIVISNIHADTEGFRGVLAKVDFSKDDALVIVGDILEISIWLLDAKGHKVGNKML